MIAENSTGNPARLPLAERARLGLLTKKAGLDIDDVVALEHPRCTERQAQLKAALETDIKFFDNLARPYSIGGCPGGWVIRRTAYRIWRRRDCPNHLLPESSARVELWLGATPPAESIPLKPSQQDKRDCQDIARQLWTENPHATQADLLKNPLIKRYRNMWRGKNTLPNWLREIDPRPKSARKGRPRNSA